ncbi:MAG: SDR family NAD(P)-dependent oxidoreductase [Alphaproteobacteria bacterium]|nr:SDR family NAD(P)-dependent oxidoreductase [Alphaproteobacteria bacterium]
MPDPQSILITGATGAIGAALAQAYARPGATLHLQGRDASRLEEVAARCRALGAEVREARLDLRDLAALRAWLDALGALDLAIVNAGVNTHVGADGAPEPWEEVEALLDVNLKAAMALVHGVLPAMRARGAGQIALIGSLAGWFGLPATPAYSASKAGLRAYGESLRGWLGPQGIRINVVMPGYVGSAMCDAMPGPKPFLWQPARAAAAIRRGLARDRARICFPFPLSWGCRALSMLPATLAIAILRRLGYGR